MIGIWTVGIGDGRPARKLLYPGFNQHQGDGVMRPITGLLLMIALSVLILSGCESEKTGVPVKSDRVPVLTQLTSNNVVFEPNDANTWVKTKAMIENFLTLLWRDGALAGAVPEHAFFVNVGLGTTMTPQDILLGIMNVEIGMAVVRPAEFIILKFSHKMQES